MLKSKMSFLANFFLLSKFLWDFLLIKILKQKFLISDPNYSLWHQVRFQNVKAENVIFGQFQTLTEIIMVFLSIVIKKS